MIKAFEISDPESCLNRSHHKEWLFIVCARDPCARATVQFWIDARIKQGDAPNDPALEEARTLAAAMADSQKRFAAIRTEHKERSAAGARLIDGELAEEIVIKIGPDEPADSTLPSRADLLRKMAHRIAELQEMTGACFLLTAADLGINVNASIAVGKIMEQILLKEFGL